MRATGHHVLLCSSGWPADLWCHRLYLKLQVLRKLVNVVRIYKSLPASNPLQLELLTREANRWTVTNHEVCNRWAISHTHTHTHMHLWAFGSYSTGVSSSIIFFLLLLSQAGSSELDPWMLTDPEPMLTKLGGDGGVEYKVWTHLMASNNVTRLVTIAWLLCSSWFTFKPDDQWGDRYFPQTTLISLFQSDMYLVPSGMTWKSSHYCSCCLWVWALPSLLQNLPI